MFTPGRSKNFGEWMYTQYDLGEGKMWRAIIKPLVITCNIQIRPDNYVNGIQNMNTLTTTTLHHLDTLTTGPIYSFIIVDFF